MNYIGSGKTVALHRVVSVAFAVLAMLSIISCGVVPATNLTTATNIATQLVTPVVSSISPNSGGAGNTIIITGSNFITGAQVFFGSVSATSVSVISANQISAIIPAGTLATSVSVSVENPGGYFGVYSGGQFTYTSGGAILAAPTITSFSPAVGPVAGGTLLQFIGVNFVAGDTIAIGGINCGSVSVLSPTQMTCITGAAAYAGYANPIVTNLQGLTGTAPTNFTYYAAGTIPPVVGANPAPIITGVSPSGYWPQGNIPITITGSNFLPGAQAYFDGIALSNVLVTSATTITAVIPAHAAGFVSVRVVNYDSQAYVLPYGFQYLVALPSGVSITANGFGNQYLFTDQAVSLYWSSWNEVSCQVIANKSGLVLSSSLTATVPAPAIDYINDDTYTASCLNQAGQTDTSSVAVLRMAHAVGGPNHASYVLATEADAIVCAQKIAACSHDCAEDVRIGRTRDIINQGTVIVFDNPKTCKCNPGNAAGWYNWF